MIETFFQNNGFIFVPNLPQYKGTDWIVGTLILMRTFYGLPPDLEDYPIGLWEVLIKEAKEINKAPKI